MSEGLEALHHPRIKSARVDISAEGKHNIAYMHFDDTKQYAAIENELKDYYALKKECEEAKWYQEHKALNEIVALHDKWLGNGMSDFEFFTLLNDIKYKYGLENEVLKWNNIADTVVIVAMAMLSTVALKKELWEKKVPNASINARTLNLIQ